MKFPIKIRLNLNFRLALAADVEAKALKWLRIGIAIAALVGQAIIAFHKHHLI